MSTRTNNSLLLINILSIIELEMGGGWKYSHAHWTILDFGHRTKCSGLSPSLNRNTPQLEVLRPPSHRKWSPAEFTLFSVDPIYSIQTGKLPFLEIHNIQSTPGDTTSHQNDFQNTKQTGTMSSRLLYLRTQSLGRACVHHSYMISVHNYIECKAQTALDALARNT